MHAAQGFPYQFPDLTNPLFLCKLVLEDGDSADPSGASSADATGAGSADPLGAGSGTGGARGARSLRSVQAGALAQEAAASGDAGSDRSVAAGHVVMAALLRLTCEAYLLVDPAAGTPRQRWQGIVALERAMQQEAYRKGLDDAHCWLPPGIAQRFGRRLRRLGWVRDDDWTPYCKRLAESREPTVHTSESIVEG